MIAIAPLLADIDIIKVVFALVFIVIYGINHLVSAGKKAAPPARRAGRRPVELEAVGKSPGNEQQAEIDAFLKRAAENRRKDARRETQAANKNPRGKKPARRLSESPVDAEVVGDSAQHESVSEHVKKRLSNSEFAKRAEHLADDIKRKDVEREQHLQKVFQHQVGRLGSSTTVAQEDAVIADAAEAASALDRPASSLAVMLADPKNLRQVFVLNEILSRPEDRWE